MSDIDSLDAVYTAGEERPIGWDGWMSASESWPLFGTRIHNRRVVTKTLKRPLYQRVS